MMRLAAAKQFSHEGHRHLWAQLSQWQLAGIKKVAQNSRYCYHYPGFRRWRSDLGAEHRQDLPKLDEPPREDAISQKNELNRKIMWDQNYAKLKEFYVEHGHTEVTRSVDKSLANWVTLQRVRINNNQFRETMPKDRFDKLMEIDFYVDVRQANWLEKLEELKAHKAIYGDARVPRTFPPNLELGRWVDNQRQDYYRRFAGKSHSMTDERIKALEEVGFEWNMWEAKWQDKFEKLKEHVDMHGTGQCGTKELKTWVQSQRKHYKTFLEGGKVRITSEKIQQLKSLGFLLKD